MSATGRQNMRPWRRNPTSIRGAGSRWSRPATRPTGSGRRSRRCARASPGIEVFVADDASDDGTARRRARRRRHGDRPQAAPRQGRQHDRGLHGRARRACRTTRPCCSATATSAIQRRAARTADRRGRARRLRSRGRRLRAQGRRRARRGEGLRAAGDPPTCPASRRRAPISGQRAMRAAVLRDVLPFAPRYGMEIGMTVDAVRAGHRVGEVELDLSHRATGRTLGGFVHRGRQLRDFRAVERRGAGAGPHRLAPVILAIDQGTTGSTCLVFDGEGQIAGRAYSEFEQHFPRPGWVEHDAEEIWETTRGSAARRSPTPASRAPTSTRSGSPTSARRSSRWDRDSGEPIHHALVWQDRRTAARCDELKRDGPRGPGPRAHRPRHRPLLLRARRSSGCCATPTAPTGPASGRSTPGSSTSSAASTSPTSRTPRGRCCSTSAPGAGTRSSARCSASIRARCPTPRGSAEIYGTTSEFGGEVPVAGIAGDQQAALFGQACHAPGDAKNTYGTGSFVLLNTGDGAARARSRACSARSPGGSAARRPTRSRRRCSSPARRCSGCATASA